MKIIEGKEIVAPRIVYYAVPGFGKTTFASKFPNPILVRTEDGGRNIAVKKTEALETYLDFKDAIEWLMQEPHEFKTVVIDTLDQLELLITKDVCAQEGKTDLGEIGFGRGEKKSAAFLSQVLGQLDVLNKERGMIVLLLAHSTVSEVKDPINDPYSRFRININEKYCLPEVERWADCILFGNYKIRTKEHKAGAKKLIRPVGDFDTRVIYTEGRPSFLAKNRYGLPKEIELAGTVKEVDGDVANLLNMIRENITK